MNYPDHLRVGRFSMLEIVEMAMSSRTASAPRQSHEALQNALKVDFLHLWSILNQYFLWSMENRSIVIHRLLI